MFALNELREIMLTCGTDVGVDLDGNITDTPVDELGFDSLAMLHIAALIQRRVGVSIPDHLALELKTPGAVVDFVNDQLKVA